MSEVTVYPTADYDSWIGVEDADTYFNSRINSDPWTNSDELVKYAALKTAFRSLEELGLDLTDLDSDDSETAAAILKALQQAQCEQTFYELKHDVDGMDVKSISLGGLLSMSMAEGEKVERYSPRALKMIAAYRTVRTISRVR
jgi:hypothetical protein